MWSLVLRVVEMTPMLLAGEMAGPVLLMLVGEVVGA